MQGQGPVSGYIFFNIALSGLESEGEGLGSWSKSQLPI